MFIEFQIGNFRSFRDVQKFSMQAAPVRANDGGLEEENVFQQEELRLLKTKAIFGSNASGKSNLIDALIAFSMAAESSVINEGLISRIWNDRFKLLTEWDEQPVFFQYTFFEKKTIYRYGFEVLENEIINEWLFGTSEKKELEYFLRSRKNLSLNNKYFPNSSIYIEQANREDNEIYRPDSLFLTAVALNGNILAGDIRSAIKRNLFFGGVDSYNDLYRAQVRFEKSTSPEQHALIQFLKAADTGIDDLKVSNNLNSSKETNLDQEKRLLAVHKRYNENGEFVDQISVPFTEWESKGTQKLFGAGVLIMEVLTMGKILIIDEFDAKFHPNLTLKIVELFQSNESNPKNAQLIFVTHDSGLLRKAKLRRDQICFVDKDKYGISTLRTLIEYKGVRKDASYEKEYLQGSYAGVPYLDELDSVITQTLHDNGVSETK